MELINPEKSERIDREDWKLKAELHQRLVLPLYAISLVFIALAGVLSGEFSRRGRTKRIAAAATIGVALLIAAMALFRVSGNSPLITPALYFMPIVSTIFAAYLTAGGSFKFARPLFNREPMLPEERKQ